MGKATLRLPPTVEPDVVTAFRRHRDLWPTQFFNYWQKESGEFVWWPSKEWTREFPPGEYRLNFSIVIYPSAGHPDARAPRELGSAPHNSPRTVALPSPFTRRGGAEATFWCNKEPYGRVANVNCFGDVSSPTLDWTFGISWPEGRPLSAEMSKDIEGVLAYIASNLTDPAVK